MSNATIIAGTFALVSSGNCTDSYILDGDDVQHRADAAMDPYWGDRSIVIERGIEGFGVSIGGEHMVDLYLTREAAESAIARTGG